MKESKIILKELQETKSSLMWYNVPEGEINWIESTLSELTKERDEAYEKGYSDGRNGLHNQDLIKKVEDLTKERDQLREENRKLDEKLTYYRGSETYDEIEILEATIKELVEALEKFREKERTETYIKSEAYKFSDSALSKLKGEREHQVK